jgi:Flp pilus assembly protein TadD
MPRFGDFETIGDPFARHDERGHVTTIWQARREGDSRLYAVKVYIPLVRPTPAGQASDVLEKDPALDFLEAIKQTKKAQSEGVSGLTPIYDLGRNGTEAWYVTDFYPRNSLKAWIDRRGEVDGAALANIVFRVAAACNGLRRTRGLSHGNLKPSNVFLVGKPRPLRQTPLHLADPYPASLERLSKLNAPDTQEIASLLHQVMEAHDLRGIGELILQLVEGRLFARIDDYNYPVERSPAWDRLGKDGEKWRQLCNRLLDPQLSLDSFNLQTLERECQPGALAGKTPLVAGGLALICILGAGIYFGVPLMRSHNLQKGEAKYKAALEAAAQSLHATNLSAALVQIEQALATKPGDSEASQLKEKILQKIEVELTSTLARARVEMNAGRLDSADAILTQAESLKPGNPQTANFKKELEDRRTAGRSFQDATNQAWKAFANGEYARAIDMAGKALNFSPGEPSVTNLLGQAKVRERERVENDRAFTNLIAQAEQALKSDNFLLASNYASAALGRKPKDGLAERYLKEATGKLAERARLDAEYAEAMRSGKRALEAGNFPEAATQAQKALGSRPMDPDAEKLRKDAEARMSAANLAEQREGAYRTAMNSARSALENKDFTEAIRQADVALTTRTNDTSAANLRRDAERAQARAVQEQEQERNFQTATNAAQQALASRNYSKASNLAQQAKSLKPLDPNVARLIKESADGMKIEEDRAKLEGAYRAATNSAGEALAKKDYLSASNLAQKALDLKPGDPSALKLRTSATDSLTAIAAEALREKNFTDATNAATTALRDSKFEQASNWAQTALLLRPRHPVANSLLDQAVAGARKAAADVENEANYKSATNQAWSAWQKGDLSAATNQAGRALKIRPDDTFATKIMRDESNYRNATNQAAQAWEKQDFQGVTNSAGRALGIRPGDDFSSKLLQQGIAKLENEQKFQVATNLAAKALLSGDFQVAVQQATEATRLKSDSPAAKALLGEAKEALSSVSSHPPLDVQGLNFVWIPRVPGAGGKPGAYVSKFEVTRGQYKAIVGSLPADQGPGRSGDAEDDLPVNLSTLADATKLCDRLNQLVSEGKVNCKGKFTLPTTAQFEAMVGLEKAEFEPGKLTVSADAYNQLKTTTPGDDLKENTGIEDSPVRSALKGKPNRFGLVNALGNGMEWGEGGAYFGLSHQSTGRGGGRDLVRRVPPPRGTVVTVRPVLVQ